VIRKRGGLNDGKASPNFVRAKFLSFRYAFQASLRLRFKTKTSAIAEALPSFVGKTGRTVWGNNPDCQYIIIIGGRLLTSLLTGTDRLERAF
jgi:hypothetical protein